jgi:hypothetical protein
VRLALHTLHKNVRVCIKTRIGFVSYSVWIVYGGSSEKPLRFSLVYYLKNVKFATYMAQVKVYFRFCRTMGDYAGKPIKMQVKPRK